MPKELEFYGNWLFYGGIIAAILFGATIYIKGRRSGHDKLLWKDYVIWGLLYSIPTVFVPIWLAPTVWWKKLLITVVIISVAILHYLFITKKQHELYLKHLQIKADRQKKE